MATPSRRDTLFPGSSSAQGLGKRRNPNDEDHSSRLSASQIPPLPHKRRAPPPPALPVKVNPESQHFTTSSRFPLAKHSVSLTPICRNTNPWERYFAILEEEQATVAYRKEPKHPIVAIKHQARPSGDTPKKIITLSHENIVTSFEAYLYDGNLYFIYDLMDVSLAEIQSTPYGTFEEYHIATICREVLIPDV